MDGILGLRLKLRAYEQIFVEFFQVCVWVAGNQNH